MADIIIVTGLVIAVFFIVRGQLRRLREGQCCGGCSGCCGSCGGCHEAPAKRAEN